MEDQVKKPNTSEFKKILALVRGANFAHPGGQEAIDLVFQDIPKNPSANVLDVGCGLGGTAAAIQQGGYGRVVGIDVVPDTIEYAKQRYPEIDFVHCDVLNVDAKLDEKFDLFYFFNSYYAFLKQPEAFLSLRKVAKPDSTLVLFDYSNKNDYEKNRPAHEYDVIRHPIDLSQTENWLRDAGWTVYFKKDLTTDYKRWYEAFVKKIETKRSEIVAMTNEDVYAYVYGLYTSILESIHTGHMGGVVLYAD